MTCQHAPSQRGWRLCSRACLVFSLQGAAAAQRPPWAHGLKSPALEAAAVWGLLHLPAPPCQSLHTVKVPPSRRTSVFGWNSRPASQCSRRQWTSGCFLPRSPPYVQRAPRPCFLSSLAFCALPRSLTYVLGCGIGWKQQEMRAASAISVGKNLGCRLSAFRWVLWEYSRSCEVNFQEVLPPFLASSYKWSCVHVWELITHVLDEGRNEWLFSGAKTLGWWGAGAVGNRCWAQGLKSEDMSFRLEFSANEPRELFYCL